MTTDNTVLSMKNLSISFGKRTLLKSSDFTVPQNSITLIQGPNGSGKTSILRAIIGQLKTKGNLLHYQGVPISKKNIDAFRQSIAYVEQSDDVFTAHTPYDYVRQSISISQKKRNTDSPFDSENSNENTSPVDTIESLFEYFNKKAIMHQPIKKLSGGELRITSLIAGFARETDLYILDEPINKLDHETAKKVGQYLNHLKDMGAAILVITHCRMFLESTRAYKIENESINKMEDAPPACYMDQSPCNC